MDLGLSGKRCVVTGSTGGIGAEVVRQLRAEGARVVSSGRSADGPGDQHVVVDLTRRGEPERLIREAAAFLGGIDVLVNNVGGTDIRKLADRLRAAGTEFVIEPYLRFAGEPGEQWTMFFRDPAGNALEFKAFSDESQVFAK